ncbi:MAG: hypothetical protein Q4B99_03535 [Clostridia bacterium]|nr:hypothetical protein [Clostridia bacterium]
MSNTEFDAGRASPHADASSLSKLASALSRTALTQEEAVLQTEQRLRAYPIIKDRLRESQEEYDELSKLGVDALKRHSLSLVRALSPGLRLTPDEIHKAQLDELHARIFLDSREVRKIETALELIAEDPYASVIKSYYFRDLKESIIAERLCCDRATVNRNRKRLLARIALRLYGAPAAPLQT